MSDKPKLDSYQIWAARREQGAQKAREHDNTGLADRIQATTTPENYREQAAGNTGWAR